MDTIEPLSTLMIIGAMLSGVILHISKKASTRILEKKGFNLKSYLLENPYQTIAMFAGVIGAYFQLVNDPMTPVTLFGAFTAGVAANSLSDMAKGSR